VARPRAQVLAPSHEDEAEPDFLAFLQARLNLNGVQATDLLGRWLAGYRPKRRYTIDILAPREVEQP
jgi:hypothetical protein